MALLNRNMADVSSNNGVVNVKAYAVADFCRMGVKATQGATYVDPRLASLANDCHENGVSVSFYHFCSPGEASLRQELNHFWRWVEPFVLPGDILHLDLERGLAAGEPKPTAAYLDGFHHGLKRISGKWEVPYMDLSYYEQLEASVRSEIDWYWIAAYGDIAPKLARGDTLWAWQHTDGQRGCQPHVAPGIGPCDMSFYLRRTALADRVRLSRGRRKLARSSR